MGFSLYEGRTRGKRVKYTYSDEEDDVFSDFSVRRSARNTGTNTPTEQVTTMSGRQVRAPTRLGPDGESVQGDVSGGSGREEPARANGRPTRAATRAQAANGWGSGNGDSMEDDDENEASEPDYGDEEGDDEHVPDESNDDEEDFDEEELLDEDLDVQGDRSLVVKLAVPGSKLRTLIPAGLLSPANETKDAHDIDMKDAPADENPTRSELPGQLTPEATVKGDSENGSRTPAAGVTATPLAFRGSPEKPQTAPHPAPIETSQ